MLVEFRVNQTVYAAVLWVSIVVPVITTRLMIGNRFNSHLQTPAMHS
jgi:hypothetical protein